MSIKEEARDIKGLKKVKDQYEDYPYPARDPEEEKDRLLMCAGDNIHELNHWLFKGKKKFDKNFRILVAGGGTGDASTYYAAQLEGTGAEVVYLDFSKASLKIAKRRAEIRGAKNIKFIHDSILNIPNLDLGKFDFINCFGCLHHLESPDEGLKLLTSLLKEDGGMHLMVYAKYGRTAVYHMQELMKLVNDGEENRAQEVANAKLLLDKLPNTNWFARSPDLFNDHTVYGDIGIYDMFLHKQDRAYSVAEMFDYVENQGLNFVSFSDIEERIALKIENFITDTTLLGKIKKMPIKQQYTISEILLGNQRKHSFYVSKQKDVVANCEDLDHIPMFYNLPENAGAEICKMMKDNNVPMGHAISLNLNNNWRIKGAKMNVQANPITSLLLSNIDAKKTLRDIFDLAKKENKKLTEKEFIAMASAVLAPFFETATMLLRHKSTI